MYKELEMRKSEITEEIETIYFGGGTPSILTESELAQFFEVIYNNYKIAENPEITLEANPDDLTIGKLKSLKNLNFNRLSIGIQSFHDEELKMMNRVHAADEAIKSVENAQNVGFENITIDLIYGIPGSNDKKWQQNLDTFLSLGIPHLSSYALTVEKKTALDHLIKVGKIAPTDDQLAHNQFYLLRNFMLHNGFEHYELSNFAKPNFYSKHNVSYWQSKRYLGIGPSAHSFDKKSRSWNISSNAKYIQLLSNDELAFEREILTPKNSYNEYVMTGLRTKWGVNLEFIEKQFGIEYLKYFNEKTQKYLNNNQLYKINSCEVGVKPEALFLIDGIISELFWV